MSSWSAVVISWSHVAASAALASIARARSALCSRAAPRDLSDGMRSSLGGGAQLELPRRVVGLVTEQHRDGRRIARAAVEIGRLAADDEEHEAHAQRARGAQLHCAGQRREHLVVARLAA